MGDYRNSKKILICGRSGSGKSVTAANLVKQIMKSKQKKHVIVHDPQNRFEDTKTETVYNAADLDRYFKENSEGRNVCVIKNAIFVFDESQMLWGTGHKTQSLIDLLALARENGNDVIFITHHPRLVPPAAAIYLTDFFIFTTGAGAKTFDDDRIEASQTLMHCMEAVKGYVKTYPRGEEGLGIFPIFPFAHIDSGKGTVRFINMPEITVKKIGEEAKIEYQQYEVI